MLPPETLLSLQQEQQQNESCRACSIKIILIKIKDHETKNNKYEGKVIINGAEMSKIAVTTNYGFRETWYFNNQSHYLAQTEEPLDSPEGMSTVTTTFEDYKDVGGIKLPFTHIIKMPGQTRIISFAEMKANQEVEKTIFSLPK